MTMHHHTGDQVSVCQVNNFKISRRHKTGILHLNPIPHTLDRQTFRTYINLKLLEDRIASYSTNYGAGIKLNCGVVVIVVM